MGFAVVCVGVLAVGVLVYALTSPGGHDHGSSRTVAAVSASDPQPARSTTHASAATTKLHLHPHVVVPATTMPSPSDSRAPKLPAGAAKAAAGS